MEVTTAVLLGVMIIGFGAVVYMQWRIARPQTSFKAEKFIAELYEKNEELRDKNSGALKDMLENNKQQIDLITRELKDQLKDGRQDAKSMQSQNAALQQALRNANEITKELKTSTDSLRNLLSNNRLRGEWGEQVAEDLLLGAGLVPNVNFTKQSTTKEGRPDFTVLLPDGTKLNVDAKFPFDDLVAYQESTGQEKTAALKRFERSVKEKIKQITSKDYINPEDNTVDFVVMFIPNEMIFSFIYEKLPHMSEYCNKHKVIMTGPFGFTALIRLVLQAYKNFQYEKGLQYILGLIEKFKGEYDKFGDSMSRLGKQIETTRTTFGEVDGTRHRQLTRLVDKIGEYSSQEKLVSESPEPKGSDKE